MILIIVTSCYAICKTMFLRSSLFMLPLQNRTHVPKFGDWTEDAPFTVVFDKASRSKKNTSMSKPDEYPDMNPNPAQTRNPRHDQPQNQNVRPRHERLSSREETEFRSSPAHNNRNNIVRAPPTPETYNHQPYGGGGRSAGETNRRQPHDPPPVQPRPIRNLRGQRRERVWIFLSLKPFLLQINNVTIHKCIFCQLGGHYSAVSYIGIGESELHAHI